MNKNDSQLYTNLKREHRARLLLRPTLTALLAIVFFLFFQTLIPIFLKKETVFDFQLCAVSCSVFLAVAAFLFQLRRSWRTLAKTATELDAEADAKNRLETAVALRKTNHLLKDLQLQDARKTYAGFRFSKRPFYLKLVLACLCIGQILNAALLKNGYRVSQKAASGQTLETKRQNGDAAKEQEAETIRKTAENAELLLTLPEQETRAKPLDELEWEGTGTSSNGFSKVVLALYLNGLKKLELEPDAPPKRKGEIKVRGFILLEDLDAKPFDLVSYHLTGISEVNGKRQTILSPPQFIEVRPFREEIGILEAVPGGVTPALNMLNLFLGIQIDLNKALFRAKILQLRQTAMEKKEFRKALASLLKEQNGLSADLEQFLDSEDARKIPADAVNHLEKALIEMKKSSAELKRSL